jgi:hypothetical protein
LEPLPVPVVPLVELVELVALVALAALSPELSGCSLAFDVAGLRVELPGLPTEEAELPLELALRVPETAVTTLKGTALPLDAAEPLPDKLGLPLFGLGLFVRFECLDDPFVGSVARGVA